MPLVKNEMSSFIDECFKEALNSQKEKTSLAGEPVKVSFKNIRIIEQQVSVDCEVKGYTGEVYDQYSLKFDSVVFPYYYLEVLRLALISFWSGNLLTKKDKKRFLFILEYGETNKFYLNRSLKYLHYAKKLIRVA
ncbi:hypothetical protein [Priestia aryabhattai]